MANTDFHTARAVHHMTALSVGDPVVVDLDAWLGLERLNAPVTYHHWGISTDQYTGAQTEMVTLSSTDGFHDWATSGAMDDVHIRLAVSAERSMATRMALADGLGRGVTTAPVKAAWKASYRRTA